MNHQLIWVGTARRDAPADITERGAVDNLRARAKRRGVQLLGEPVVVIEPDELPDPTQVLVVAVSYCEPVPVRTPQAPRRRFVAVVVDHTGIWQRGAVTPL